MGAMKLWLAIIVLANFLDAAPFQVLTRDKDDNGDPIGGVNFKISSKIPISKNGKTLTLMLPGKEGQLARYLLRYKGPKETEQVFDFVKLYQK